MSLHSRFVVTYAAVVFAGLLLLAITAVVSIDRTLRAGVDTRLRAEGYAAAALIDTKSGNIALDADDRQQFLTLVSAGDQGIVAEHGNRVVLSTVALRPPAIAALAGARAGFYTVGTGESQARADVIPIARDGPRVGTVVVWRPSDWIAQADRETALAFGAAALVIASLTMLAGKLVTKRALDDAFARQRRFTADASHELRAPLAVIRAEADLALRRDRSADEYTGALQTIASEADRMELLTQQLLSAARVASRRSETQPVDVAELAESVAARLSPAAAARNASIRVTREGAAIAAANPASLERALVAAVHNAVKFAGTPGTVAIDVRGGAGSIEIAVCDNGPGFSPEALQHAFERFWRDDAASGSAGSGLGLAIAKESIEASGGRITLSNGSHGARVLFRVPRAARSA